MYDVKVVGHEYPLYPFMFIYNRYNIKFIIDNILGLIYKCNKITNLQPVILTKLYAIVLPFHQNIYLRQSYICQNLFGK